MNTIAFKRLDHILITIPEGAEQVARLFYKETLGLEEISGEHPRAAMWFKIGDIELHIRAEPASSLSARHPAFEVEDLQAAKVFLERSNISISYSSEIDGRQRCFFRDPFGNRFELLEHDL